MKWLATTVVCATAILGARSARAEEPPAAAQEHERERDPNQAPSVEEPVAVRPRRHVAFEVNLLWPFFPGGITELRLMIPLLRADAPTFHGELVTGAYSDFANRIVRGDEHGKVSNFSGKIGWRQFFVYGLHAEVSANLGWRHEEHRPPDDTTVDGFQIRLWTLAGYQHDFTRSVYANARLGLGVHLYRSDRLASEEKKLVPGGDINLGFRF